MVDLGPLAALDLRVDRLSSTGAFGERVTVHQRRIAREVIRRHDELLAIRLDRYDPIPERHPDAYLANMLDVLEEQRIVPLRPSPMETERR